MDIFRFNPSKIGLVAAFAIACGSAAAQSPVSSMHFDGATIRLLSAPSMASALLADSISLEQDERLVFVSIELEEGWKTYWRLPGRFGLAPVLDWATSQNIVSIETIFPMPTLFDEGDGSSIGYTGAVLWPVRLRPDNPKEPILINLTLELGLCEELCFPVTADLSARLAPSTLENAALADVLALASALPLPAGELPATMDFLQDEDGLRVDWQEAQSADHFAVAENDEGKHSLLRLDGSGSFRGPWRYEEAPDRLTIISPTSGMQIFNLSRQQ